MKSSGQVAEIPYGFADMDSGVIYIDGADGRLCCLDSASGEVLARTEFQAHVLALKEGQVFGWKSGVSQQNVLEAFKARRRGGTLTPVWERRLELPGWVNTVAQDPASFNLSADINHELVITWEAHSRYRGGAPPPERVEIAQTHDEYRRIRIDTTSGEVLGEEAVEIGKAQAEEDFRTMPLVSYRRHGSWAKRPWRTGSKDVFLVRASGQPGITLRHRDASNSTLGADILLTKDNAAELVVTPDGGFIFASEPAQASSDWKVFSAETGRQVSSLPYETSPEDAAVVGSRVFYVVAETRATPSILRRLLRCRDLESGALQWSYLLGEIPVSKMPPLPL